MRRSGDHDDLHDRTQSDRYLGSSDYAWIPGGRVTVPRVSTGY